MQQRRLFGSTPDPSDPLSRARIALIAAAHRLVAITSDDVWEVLEGQGVDPYSFHHNAVGAAFRDACRSGMIRKTSLFLASTRPAARSRMVRVWVSSIARVGA